MTGEVHPHRLTMGISDRDLRTDLFLRGVLRNHVLIKDYRRLRRDGGGIVGQFVLCGRIKDGIVLIVPKVHFLRLKME